MRWSQHLGPQIHLPEEILPASSPRHRLWKDNSARKRLLSTLVQTACVIALHWARVIVTPCNMSSSLTISARAKLGTRTATKHRGKCLDHSVDAFGIGPKETPNFRSSLPMSAQIS
jgi:hypothetical protein